MKIKAQVDSFLMFYAGGAAACLGFLAFVFFLQTPVFSIKSLLLASALFLIAWILFYIGMQVAFQKFSIYLSRQRILLYGNLLALLFLPHFWPHVSYPIFPFFQHHSVLQATFTLDSASSTASLKLADLWVNTGTVLYRNDFSYSGDWVQKEQDLVLPAGGQGRLTWQGPVAEKNELVINSTQATGQLVLNWDGEVQSVPLTGKPLVLKKAVATPFWFVLLVFMALVFLMGAFLILVLGFFLGFLMVAQPKQQRLFFFLLFFCLSLLTVFLQFENPEIKGRFESLVLPRHQNVLMGTAGNPWQYRILSEWLVEGIVLVFGGLRIPNHQISAFFFLRLLQNLTIYLLFYRYLERLKVSTLFRFLGALFLTGVLLNIFFQSDLSLNTYFDLIFYLSVCLLVQSSSYQWLPLVLFFASLNRETSILALGFVAYSWLAQRGWKKANLPYLIGLGPAWALPFISVRLIYPHIALIKPYGYSPGLDLFFYNLRLESFILLGFALGFGPLLSLLSYSKWPPMLKTLFYIIVPAWIVVHSFGSVISETRLFLVPQALVFLPGLLLFLEGKTFVTSTNTG
ncbi:MAG: hypothetical protein U0Z26_04435 [Anaerolineales bacterium]